MLALMLERRALGVPESADRAGVTTDDVGSLLEGKAPSDALLRQLAPALGFHSLTCPVLVGAGA